MRILVCMTRFCPWSQQIAATLQANGDEVHVFDFQDNPDDGYLSPKIAGISADFEKFRCRVSGVHLVNASTVSKLRYLWAGRALRNMALELRADMVLSLYGGGFALMAYLSGFRPYCVYVVGSDVLKAGRIERHINARTLGRAARVFANGAFLASQTAEQSPEARIMPLLIGVESRLFDQAEPVLETAHFVCTRGFQPVYNNDAIIRAVAKIPPGAGPFRLVFTSAGRLLDDARALADRILPADLRDRVSFLGGVSYERLLQELHASHAILSMARSDGTATSVLEGMACGLYPILSDIPQNRALVRHGESVGALVPLDDDSALANAMVDVMRNAASRAEAARQNRHFIARFADSQVNGRILAREIKASASYGSGSH